MLRAQHHRGTGRGIECGAYFFSRAISEDEAREEAEFALAILGDHQLTYPFVFDFERDGSARVSNVSASEATRIARAFCDVVREHGRTPMLYGNSYELEPFGLDELDDCSLWLAEYGPSPHYDRPFVIWQYANHGFVNGIPWETDLNLDLSAAL